MAPHTDDLRIRRIDALVPPAQLIAELPCSETASETVDGSRRALHRIGQIAGVNQGHLRAVQGCFNQGCIAPNQHHGLGVLRNRCDQW